MELPIAAWNSELPRIVHLKSLPEHDNFFAIDSVVRLVLLVDGDGYGVTTCPAAGLDSLTLPA